jgi:hypothetical protein
LDKSASLVDGATPRRSTSLLDVMATRCAIWEPIPGIATRCADISFRYEAPNSLHVLMRFSNVAEGPTQDLALEFSGPILLRWEDEAISRDDLDQGICDSKSSAISLQGYALAQF